MWICSVNKMVPKYFHIRVYFHPDQKLLDSKMTQEVWQGFVGVECRWKCGQIRWLARSGRWWQLDGAWLWRKGSRPCEKCSRWWWVYVRVTEKQIISLMFLCDLREESWRGSCGAIRLTRLWRRNRHVYCHMRITSPTKQNRDTFALLMPRRFIATFVFTLVWFLGEFNTFSTAEGLNTLYWKQFNASCHKTVYGTWICWKFKSVAQWTVLSFLMTSHGECKCLNRCSVPGRVHP